MRHEDRLRDRMQTLGVRTEDLEEGFSRSGGPGGQNVNKVNSAATIRHLPTGLAVTASDSRSQSVNRHLALSRLLDLFEKQKKESRRARLAAISKARRQYPRRSRITKATLVEGKRHRGETKKLRGKIHPPSPPD
jgi:protein subunit release factor B